MLRCFRLRRRVIVMSLAVVCGLHAGVSLSSLAGAERSSAPPNTGATSRSQAKRPVTPHLPSDIAPATQTVQEAFATGRLVDLRTYMKVRDATSWSAEQIAENLRAGVPAVIVSEGQTYLLDHSSELGSTLPDLAMLVVKARGAVYHKGGITFLEMTRIDRAQTAEHHSAGSRTRSEDSEPARAGKVKSGATVGPSGE